MVLLAEGMTHGGNPRSYNMSDLVLESNGLTAEMNARNKARRDDLAAARAYVAALPKKNTRPANFWRTFDECDESGILR